MLLAQVGVRGLQPALREAERLDEAEAEVSARYAASRARFEDLRREAEAWTDAVYRERQRRAGALEASAGGGR